MTHETPRRYHEVLVIGGGQNGLAASYHLAQAGIDHLILERDDRVGDVWRSRYESLKLYTPAIFDALPGLSFPLDPMAFPSGSQMADYLEDYARHFELPVETGVSVKRLEAQPGGGFELTTSAGAFAASHVILATGPFQVPQVPAFASELDEGIQQTHSGAYRNPQQIADGAVLVVGASHSGSDLARELAESHPTLLSGRIHANLPLSVDNELRRVLWPLFRAFASKVLTIDTPIGRKMAENVRKPGAPLLRNRLKDLRRAGVEWTEERVVGVEGGQPKLADGRVLDVASVVWCTGFTADYEWISPSIVGEDGWPLQERGVIPTVPGLYVLGTLFQYGFLSMLVTGAGHDSRYVVEHLLDARAARQPLPMAA